jgi:hypothetical protein
MNIMEKYVLSKLYSSDLTRREILYEDAHLHAIGKNGVQQILDRLELAGKVSAKVVIGRGEVYRSKETPMNEKVKENQQRLKRLDAIADTLSRDGLTIAELLPRLEDYTPEGLQAALDELEREKFVYHEEVKGRGRVYRRLVFETLEDACKAKGAKVVSVPTARIC